MARMTPEQLIAALRSQPKGDPSADWPKARAFMEQQASKAPLHPGSTVDPVDVGGTAGEWVAAPGADAGVNVLYLHGGGFTRGSCVTHRALASHLSAATGGRVLTIDYRLSPEHPYPAALDDAVAAWHWLLAQPGVEAGRAAIAGDSAGGNLAAATVLRLLAAGAPLPAAAVCLSPWVDLAATGDSFRTKADADPMIDADALKVSRDAYLAGADPSDPFASPVLGNWEGAPPLLVQVGSEEVLLDDARSLAAAAGHAGVAVALEEWSGMVHVFQSFHGLVDDAARAVDEIGAFIRANLAPSAA
jgi:monoterpene epsilon-lactone hydrolase